MVIGSKFVTRDLVKQKAMTSLVHWFVYVFFLVSGMAIFLRGFFPMKAVVQTVAHVNETCFSLDTHVGTYGDTAYEECALKATFDRVIFILIDALRADFVLPHAPGSFDNNLAHMKFVRSLIERNETISFVAVAQPPTVTMPRVKALMSGTVPGFVDVMLNFDSAELTDDNILLQLRLMGKKLVFYGDDTWIRLFPGSFLRSDGTTSFFVTDYTEVDENVTRHLGSELKQTDWDILILHYLGLDHIGHLVGPRSPLVQPKLDEMDSIVQRLFNAAVIQDRDRHLRTLIVLCGDHGMSDQGSHGGSTTNEVNTPVIFMSSSYLNGAGVHFSGQKIQQIDVAPTLSLLLGLPIPHNSLGMLAMEALANNSVERKLKLAFINAQQLLKVLKENEVNYDQDDGFKYLEVAISMHRTLLTEATSLDEAVLKTIGEKTLLQYLKAIGLMRSKLISSLANYDSYSMVIGIASVWLVLVKLISGNQHSSMKAHLMPYNVMSGLCWLIFAMLHLSVCTSSSASSSLCHKLPLSTVYVATMFSALISSVCVALWRLSSARIPKVSVLWFFWTINVLHTFSLTSSSFVEEEHQTWYFITMTTYVLGLLGFCLQWVRSIIPRPKVLDVKTENAERDRTCYDSKTAAAAAFYGEAVLSTVAVAVIGRVMRSWNQTGDKWSHLPDVGDWLVRPENKCFLSMSALAALLVAAVIVWKMTRHNQVTVIFVSATAFIYFRHGALKVVDIPFFFHANVPSKGLTEAHISYFLIMLQACLAVVRLYSHHHPTDEDVKVGDVMMQSVEKITDHDGCSEENVSQMRIVLMWRHLGVVWTMLMLLLSRPHNMALVSMLLVKKVCFQFSVSHIEKKWLSPVTLSLVYLWLGQAAFFYQGNSNSLASIDIGAGYVGMSNYHPVIIGFLMFVNTYSGPIYWLLALQEQLAITFGDSRYSNTVVESSYTILVAKTLVMAFYIILVTVQRYHLFVWTVFSPKLLYEASSTAVTVITLFCCLIATVLVTGRHKTAVDTTT